MDNCISGGVATLACIPALFNNIIAKGIGLASLGLLFFLAFSAAKFITSGGDPARISSAKKSLTYALIGFVIITGSFLIITIIATITNTDCQLVGINCH